MKFVKYQLVLEDMNESSYNETFPDDSFWNEIEQEAKKYGIEGLGVNQHDQVVVMGEINAMTAAMCNGLMNELKAWLKQRYKSKVMEHLVAKGSLI